MNLLFVLFSTLNVINYVQDTLENIQHTHTRMHTISGHHTLVLLESPANLSTTYNCINNHSAKKMFRNCVLTLLIPGKFKKVPNIGTLLKKLIATGKNPLKNKENNVIGSFVIVCGVV